MKQRKKVDKEGHIAEDRTVFKHVQLADAISIALNLEKLPPAKGGYSALNFQNKDDLDCEREYRLEELTSLGITVLEWDGRCSWKLDQVLRY